MMMSQGVCGSWKRVIGDECVLLTLPDDVVRTLGAFGSQNSEISGILKASQPGSFPQFLLTFPGAPEKSRQLNKTFPPLLDNTLFCRAVA